MQQTVYKNNVDFYFSFSLGVALTIAVAGFVSVGKQLLKAKRRAAEERAAGYEPEKTELPEGRGDIRPWAVILTYVVSDVAVLGRLVLAADPHRRPHPPAADRGDALLRDHLHADPQLRDGTTRGHRRRGHQPALRAGGQLHPLGLPGRGGVVPADPDPQLRLDDGLLPAVRADGHEVHEHLEERAAAHADHPGRQPVLRPLHLGAGPDPRPAVPLRAGVVGSHGGEPLAGVQLDAGRVQRVRAGLPRRLHPRGLPLRRRPLRGAVLGGRARSSSPTASSAA